MHYKKNDRKNPILIEGKERPKNYKYPLFIIQIAISIKLFTSAGFRAIEKIIAIYSLHLSLSSKNPCYGTIMLWVKKLGYDQIKINIEKADDWILIIDESIQFGHEKLLVIYGLKASSIDFTRALRYDDLTPFTIISNSKWTGEMMNEEIKKIKAKYGNIIYIVADGGNAIKKCVKLSGIPHIYDITHKFAWFIKEIYKDDNCFQSYTKSMAKMRGALCLSNVSHILPPNQRANSRFMNIKILSDWGNKVLNYLALEKTEEREYKELLWVRHYSTLITELSEINRLTTEIMSVLKIEGLSINSKKKINKIVKEVKVKSVNVKKLTLQIEVFLNDSKNMLPGEKTLLCTSDIIESSFGKYKNYINNNPMVGITNLSLCLSAFTSKLDKKEIKNAMENTKNKDIKLWADMNIGKTNFLKRREVLRKVG